jgi:hypothetical protein
MLTDSVHFGVPEVDDTVTAGPALKAKGETADDIAGAA